MDEEPLNYHWIFNVSDDLHCPAARRAGLDVDAKDPLQALLAGDATLKVHVRRAQNDERSVLLSCHSGSQLQGPQRIGLRHPTILVGFLLGNSGWAWRLQRERDIAGFSVKLFNAVLGDIPRQQPEFDWRSLPIFDPNEKGSRCAIIRLHRKVPRPPFLLQLAGRMGFQSFGTLEKSC